MLLVYCCAVVVVVALLCCNYFCCCCLFTCCIYLFFCDFLECFWFANHSRCVYNDFVAGGVGAVILDNVVFAVVVSCTAVVGSCTAVVVNCTAVVGSCTAVVAVENTGPTSLVDVEQVVLEADVRRHFRGFNMRAM